MGLIESMQDVLPDGYANAILWLAFVLLLVVAVFGLIRLIRGFTGGTFVAGGRNRRTRLAVMDAAAIDSRRRLVLVRRDDVEHLVLIGGPTDLVIERDIRIVSRPARQGEHQDETLPVAAQTSPELERARAQVRPPAPSLRPAEPARPVEPALPPRPAPAAGVTLPRASMPMSAPPPPPAMPRATPSPVAAKPPDYPKPKQTTAVQPARLPEVNSLDDALLSELSLSLGEETVPRDAAPSAIRKAEATLDEQMNRLLGEISKRK